MLLKIIGDSYAIDGGTIPHTALVLDGIEFACIIMTSLLAITLFIWQKLTPQKEA